MEDNFEIQVFDSVEDFADRNTAENCYVSSQDLVFNLSNIVTESTLVSVEDCGKDVTEKVSAADLEAKYVDNFVGYINTILGFESEEEISEKIQEETAETLVAPQKEEKTDEGTTNIAWAGAILILVILGVSLTTICLKRKKSCFKK